MIDVVKLSKIKDKSFAKSLYKACVAWETIKKMNL